MGRRLEERLNGLKLNRKFTLVITGLIILPISILAGVLFYTMEEKGYI